MCQRPQPLLTASRFYRTPTLLPGHRYFPEAEALEGTAGEAGRLDAYALGLGDPVAISAEHNEGLADLYDALRVALPEQTAPAEERAASAVRSASDPRRHCRAAECRQIDAGQPADRRGAPADRAGGRHHA